MCVAVIWRRSRPASAQPRRTGRAREVAADPFVAGGLVAAAPPAAQDPHPGVQVAGHRFRECVDPGRDDALVVPVAAFGVQVGDCGGGRSLLVGLQQLIGLIWL